MYTLNTITPTLLDFGQLKISRKISQSQTKDHQSHRCVITVVYSLHLVITHPEHVACLLKGKTTARQKVSKVEAPGVLSGSVF